MPFNQNNIVLSGRCHFACIPGNLHDKVMLFFLAQETFRLEILHKSIFDFFVFNATTIKDDIFLFCGHYQGNVTSWIFDIRVYSLNYMAEVQDVVIALPGITSVMTACSVSNCLYVLAKDKELPRSSVLRISRDEGHQFNIQTFMSDLSCSIYYMTVSAEGNLIIVSKTEGTDSEIVSIYCPNCLL